MAEEGRHIRELRPECNVRIEGRTNQEWREDNADIIELIYMLHSGIIPCVYTT